MYVCQSVRRKITRWLCESQKYVKKDTFDHYLVVTKLKFKMKANGRGGHMQRSKNMGEAKKVIKMRRLD